MACGTGTIGQNDAVTGPRCAVIALAIALVTVASACSDDRSHDRTVGANTLQAPSGTSAADLRRAADVVRQRLHVLGVDTAVRVDGTKLVMSTEVDAYKLAGVARAEPSTDAPVVSAPDS
jgi:hypothetical protein